MTSPSITRTERVYLDGYEYELKGEIESYSASRYAQKIVIGQEGIEAHEDISYLRWSDFSEGIGLREFYSEGGEAPKRAWFGDADLSNSGHTTLGHLAVATTTIAGTFPTAAAGDDVPALAIFKGEVYCLIRNTVSTVDRMRVYRYDNGGDSWSLQHTMPAGAESFSRNADIVTGFVSGVENIIVCAGSHYSYSTDGASYTDSTKDVMRMTIHDDALWGIDRAGQLWTSTTLGTETNKAVLPITAPTATTDIAYISDLATLPDASGELVIHCATAVGIYRYDQTNDKWIKTNITLPQARYNGRGFNIWNADLYVPAGMGLKRAIYGVETTVVDIGPDQDHGLPRIHRGAITDMAPGHDRLIVALEGDFTGFRHYSSDTADLRSLVMAYNDKGWQVLYQSATENERIRKVIIGSAYDTYRLWFSATVGSTSRTIYYIDLPSERSDPHEANSRPYSASSTLETPILHLGQDVEGIASSVLVEPHGTATNETIQVEMSVDGAAYSSLGTISGDADFEFILPSTSDPSGTVFRTIQFKMTFNRGGTNTDRPILHSLTLKFLKMIPDRQIHLVTLDLSNINHGQTPRDQYRNLRASIRKRALLEFTFRDDGAIGSEDRYWVRIKNFRLKMDTGTDYTGEIALELVEVQHVVGGQWNVDNWDELLYG